MPRIDVAEDRAAAQNAAAQLSQNTKVLAASTLDSVRSQAAAAGETIGTAVSDALDTAKQRSRAAQREAVKAAQQQAKSAAKRAKQARKRAGKRAGKKVHDLTVLAQEKAGRNPHRKRRIRLFVVIAVSGAGVAAVLGQRRMNSDDDYYSSTPPSGAGFAPTIPPTGIDDPTSTPSD